MKKIAWTCVFSLLILVSCTGKFDTNVAVSQIMNKIKTEIVLEGGVDEDIKSIDNAERYGLVLESIEEGRIYYTKSAENPDKVIIIKAKKEDNIEGIEKALSAETIGLSEAWKNNMKESKKVEDYILKTRGRYVVLIVAEDAKRVEKIFDSMITMR